MNDLKKFFANEKVSASAGSGKTFSLTSRFIALACIQKKDGLPDPFSIIALTFTKKAAGEFLAKILTRLADGAETEKGAKALAESIKGLLPQNVPIPNQETFKDVLAICARNLHKLRLSTIDSFFATMVRQNANALKIFAPVEVFETNSFEGNVFVLDTISKMISENSLTSDEVKAFANLLKKASFGKEQKNLQSTITTLVNDAHEAYQKNPDLNIWGNKELSGVESPSPEWNEQRYQELLEIVEAEFVDKTEFSAILKFLQNSNSVRFAKASSTMLTNLFEAKRKGVLKTTTAFPYRKKMQEFSCAKEIDEMLDMLFNAHFNTLCEASNAVGKIAKLYEQIYDKNIRSKGKITFTDLPYILSDESRKTEKELIEYKLDSKINHWLFDEFQDTSIKQWEVLRNLVEEAILEYEKSFYYVGDVKQSIYSWRGATPELFNGIFNYYNTNKQVIQPANPLVVSWRSGKNVIEAVNKIFGSEQNLAKVFEEQSAKMFSADYNMHISAEEDPSTNKEPKPSYAEVRMYPSAKSNAEDATNAAKEILEILKEIKPIGRGLSCAVLVSKNEEVNVIVEYLKENGFNATGDLSVNIATDRPVISLFTSILKRLAHPQNTASDAYCTLAQISDFTDNFSNSFIKKSLKTIFTNGYEAFAKEYENFMRAKFTNCANVDFKWLNEACANLDNQQFNAPDNAAEFILSQEVKTSSATGVIQVMTIHKSKGLAFAITILPIKHKSQARRNIAKVSKAVLLPPSSVLSEINPTLFEHSKISRISEDFESICKLYVATTRAERAIYILLPQPSNSSIKASTSSELTFTQHVLQCFSTELATASSTKSAQELIESYFNSKKKLSIGDNNWFESITNNQILANENPLPQPLESPKIVEEPETLSPSKTSEHNPESAIFTDFGTSIHKIFETLQTVDDFELCKKNALNKVDTSVKISMIKLLENEKFKSFFSPNYFCANEFQFSVKLNDKIINGTMDRIVLRKENNTIFATVIDYKPSTSDTEKYKKQMQIYKDATSMLFDIPKDNVSVFVAGYLDGKVAEV